MIHDNYLQAFAHFYRGEMNRLTCYRMRLDNTFQYSIVLTSALLVFYLQQKIVFTYFPLYLCFLNFFFCFIETRRYRYYLIVQKRISLMEEGFLCHQILDCAKVESARDDWVGDIASIYQKLEYTESFFICFRTRYFRNYIWLIDLIICLWLFDPPIKPVYYSLLGVTASQHLYFLFWRDPPDI